MRVLALAAIVGLAGSALAQITSYDMPNGNGVASSGSFNYWDLNYTGSGATTVDNAPLSGGVGDLTDGVITTDNWFNVENVAGTGPYVGWRAFADPTITLHLSINQVDTIRIHADDADGAGGVNLPDGVYINGTLYDVDQDAAGLEPKWLEFDNLGLNTNTVTIQFDFYNDWVFIDEIEVKGVVPEPATMTALGFGALLAVRRRRSAPRS